MLRKLVLWPLDLLDMEWSVIDKMMIRSLDFYQKLELAYIQLFYIVLF